MEIFALCSFFLGIMGFASSFLLLHPALFEVEAQHQKQQFYPYISLSGSQKPVKAKVVFNKSKCSLYLDRTVHSQMYSSFTGDVLQRLLPLLPEGFFHNYFFRRVHILLSATTFPLRAVMAILTSIPYSGHRYAVLEFCGHFSAIKPASLSTDKTILICVVLHIFNAANLRTVLLCFQCFIVGGFNKTHLSVCFQIQIIIQTFIKKTHHPTPFGGS